jgi:hypothetical protein
MTRCDWLQKQLNSPPTVASVSSNAMSEDESQEEKETIERSPMQVDSDSTPPAPPARGHTHSFTQIHSSSRDVCAGLKSAC